MAALAAMFGLFGMMNAQELKAQSPYLQGVDLKAAIEAARERQAGTKVKVDKEIKPDVETNNVVGSPNLVGTWNVTVLGQGPNPFFAMQTYGSGGTFIDTTSQLSKLLEGPSHGVYSCGTRFCDLSFEIFEFDPNGNYIGKIRLRCLLTPNAASTALSAQYTVDFIELDGTVIPDIASGTFSGVKQQVLSF
jgi:hypothetical protein